MLSLSVIANLKQKSTSRSQLIQKLCEEMNNAHGSEDQECQLTAETVSSVLGNTSLHNDQVLDKEGHGAKETPEYITDHHYSSSGDTYEGNRPTTISSESDDLLNLESSHIPLEDCLIAAHCEKHVPVAECEYIVNEENILEPVHETPPGEPMLTDVCNEVDLGPIIDADFQTINNITKKGATRKRRKYVLSPSERANIKLKRIQNSHKIKEVCNCIMKCGTVISEDQRVKLNEQYWNLSRQDQKSFVFGAVTKKPVQRRTAGCASRRKDTLQYTLKDEQGYQKKVCKVIFLSTLGYSKNNDSIIQSLCKQTDLSPKFDGRCGKTAHNKIDRTVVQEHIKSFKPSISHYRREHAPNRLYLPSDLTITSMYGDFKKQNPGFACSYDLYRQEVDKMNISFVKLGHEECEFCEHCKQHPHSPEEPDDNCQVCQAWKKHIHRASMARELYQEDKNREPSNDEIVYSVDMQKVIMLPRLEMFKNVVFAQRLSVYNETFAPVGTKSKSRVVAVVWHEGIRGRKQEDVVSSFFKFLSSSEARDVKKIVLWMDNCAAQNKNWTIFTFFVYIINSSLISADVIEVRYFEPGHTFMSADSFHHSVEKSMKTNKQSKVNDFQEATSMASKRVTVFPMQLEDFYKWKSLMSQKKIKNSSSERPYLHDIVAIQAKRGNLLLLYKKEYHEVWRTLDFLQLKIIKTGKIPVPGKQEQPRGISTLRKGSLLQLLKGKSSVVPANRLEFWHSLPLSANEGRDDASDDSDG